MNKVQNIEQKLSDVSYLIIDDEIAADKISQEDFIDDLGFANTNPQFVASCEEALNVLRKNLEIKFCFLDCKLPKTINESVNYNPTDSSDYGIQLIDEITEINQEIPIIVFSAYVDKTILKEQAKDNSNIVGYLRKDESPESYREAFKLALQYCDIPVQGFKPQNSIVSINNIGFNYDELSQQDSEIIQQKTRTIKNLARITAESIIQIGKNLIDVKQALPRGKFYAWAESEFPWSVKMVNRFMRVYDKFNDMSTEELELLPVTVLYELAPKSVSNEAIRETIDVAKSGETITVAKAKEIKSKYSEPKKNPDQDSGRKKRSTTTKIDFSEAQSPIASDEQEVNDKNSDYQLIGNNTLVDDSTKLISDSTKPKQQIVEVITQKRLWHIDKHIIYNGDPNSPNFLKLLPPKALICLNFSPDPEFKFQYTDYDSWLSLYIKNPNLDAKKLVDLISEVIASSTEELDAVIVLYIPHVDILNIVHDWYCKAYVVDPNYQKCISVVEGELNNLDPA
ncbi:DUF3102 domain-containing protein [Waterburya agarophytonicola K14]|uniref:DUF3102 domain-containing protein n=1 Tax=Waterburya agarophytonicola KI4 TaxID=2874699 RepID=A0A964FFU7_9CYAN|nr:DUF3102 domain-containing protein [Waterburya agarophytonicola]MCC0175858.1 DUF3102 domain-containing protein [Waterburya agarophytonicola KI4]